jgi:sugar lactone lactonase YvrE
MGGLYRLGEDLVARRLAGRVTAGNGLDWSPDASVLYFVDSGDYLVWAFDFDARDGSVSRKRVFASVAEPDGLPDGLTVDAAGGVWVALYGGGRLHRYAPDGLLTEVIPTPVRYPTSCAFAGPGLDTLVVTSAYARIEDAGEPRRNSTVRSWRQRPASSASPPYCAGRTCEPSTCEPPTL